MFGTSVRSDCNQRGFRNWKYSATNVSVAWSWRKWSKRVSKSLKGGGDSWKARALDEDAMKSQEKEDTPLEIGEAYSGKS